MIAALITEGVGPAGTILFLLTGGLAIGAAPISTGHSFGIIIG